MQEVITMVVFVGFSLLYMRVPLKMDYFYAGLCLWAPYISFSDLFEPAVRDIS